MGKTTTLNVRVTPEVKQGAEKILSQFKIRFYNMKRNAEGEMVLYRR